MSDVRVNTAEFDAFASKLKGVDKKVRARVRRRLRDSAREFAPEIVSEGADAMPGGLRDHIVAKGSRPTISQTAAGVRMVLGKKAGPQIGAMNAGGVRHPTYGHRPWVRQSVEAGSWTEALEKHLPDVREAVVKEVTKIMRELD